MKISLIVALAVLIISSPLTAVELGERRLYECVKVSQAPTVDGRLDDPCWQNAPVSSGFTRTLRDQEKPPSYQTHLKLVYDERYLYVGIKCDEPHPENLQATVLDEDNPSVCGDDSIELFFHPDPDSPHYYQLVSNSKGVRYDGRILDGTWNADWKAVGSVGKDAWYLEGAIALSSFPERKGVWRFNVCRELRSTDPIEFHGWSNPYGAFHNPDRFGHLIFSGPFANLRRGFLLQAADFAKSSLDKQQRFEKQKQEIERMRASVPAQMHGTVQSQLAGLRKDEGLLEQKYRGKESPSLEEWSDFDAALDSLLARSEEVYWKLKFYVLLSD
ncbi:MAG: hypothetical protein COS85_15925 [Armatimonadetes bacterium CG07_land_8_20_14_0_80_59_28]|nr:MAG: hypothetical protein COS85_15925 [Armatimonadetes bacterium CG07_land_8_20_14_0_80_59_28]PIX39838.1 MAG: hypothetical protein COZ56_16430 [Armatimonadetes bacterium CG_4_8_14_3_um_filter_58_9]PIY41736.1 MAG: hypothetical protein COZ05_15235 [Armatimonadetes bacterium CG_4_10_14_3_um_filter_59_10]PJB62158.1 MAG: hypothetical protein CO095_19120 [Armatimonadetes bacterium CG_4_9_14_3_um_filter_58_7]